MKEKCLNVNDFKKYMKCYINESGMTTKDYMLHLLMIQHIQTCIRCRKIKRELIELMESVSSEELFWQKFNEYWEQRKEKGVETQGIELYSVDLKRNEITSKVEKLPELFKEQIFRKFPEWPKEKISDNIQKLFSIDFFKKGALVGAVRGEKVSDNANNITVSYEKTGIGYTVMISTDIDIKGKLYLEDDIGNTYEAGEIEEGFLEFHNVPTEKFIVKYGG